MALLPNALSCHFHSPVPHKRSPDRSGKISFISSFLFSTVPFLLRPQIPNPNPSFSFSLSLCSPPSKHIASHCPIPHSIHLFALCM
uniref:Uncharacterized protein n=1 Tax=Sus scrofa TaxID=9823 RepID=A0A8D0MYV8_PIG